MSRYPTPHLLPLCPCGCGYRVMRGNVYAARGCCTRGKRMPPPASHRRVAEGCIVPGLFQVLRRRRMSQSHLAELLGVDPGNLSHWKAGKGHPSLATLLRLCDLLDASADELLGRDEEAPDAE